jgi:PAS domain S-box-containing protein
LRCIRRVAKIGLAGSRILGDVPPVYALTLSVPAQTGMRHGVSANEIMNDGDYQAIRALANLLADSPEPLIVVALDATIVRWNAAATDLFGRRAAQALGRPCWEIVAGRTVQGEQICNAACPILQEAAAGRSPPPTEMVISRRDPVQSLQVMVHHFTLMDAPGQPQGLVHLVEDVDERRKRERVGERFLALIDGGGDLESPLTARERAVLCLLADGHTAREVAESLGIRHATARNHIQHILAKLDVPNRLAAVARVVARDPADERTSD